MNRWEGSSTADKFGRLPTLLVLLIGLAGCTREVVQEVGVDLLDAAEQGQVEQVKALLKAGDVDAESGIGFSALMAAALNGHSDIIQILVAAGADVNGKDERGETALMRAAFRGQTEVVRVLLDAGAHVDAQTPSRVVPLMHAAFGGEAETVHVLLEAGADVNAKDGDGATALMYALLIRGDADVVTVLLEAGADVNEKNDDGWMALMLAEEEGYSEIVELLQQAGATDY